MMTLRRQLLNRFARPLIALAMVFALAQVSVLAHTYLEHVHSAAESEPLNTHLIDCENCVLGQSLLAVAISAFIVLLFAPLRAAPLPACRIIPRRSRLHVNGPRGPPVFS